MVLAECGAALRDGAVVLVEDGVTGCGGRTAPEAGPAARRARSRRGRRRRCLEMPRLAPNLGT